MDKDKTTRTDDPAMNPDPITKAPGFHPAGTGIGAATGGAVGIGAAIATGAAMGTAAGPVGTVIGAAVGAVVGGLVGKTVAEEVNPTAEHQYWRENYRDRPYVAEGVDYDQYGPAYQYGWEARGWHADKDFKDVEPELSRDWDRVKGKSTLKWDQANQAVRDSWERARPKEARR